MTYVNSSLVIDTIESSSSHGHLKELLDIATLSLKRQKWPPVKSLNFSSQVKYMELISQKLSQNMQYYALHA